jgi:hypothetical protein
MKKLIISLIIFLAFFIDIKAQAPHSFKYQAIARNNKGEVITDHNLGMRITILREDIEGDEIYVETHQVISNKFGLINLEIGNGISIRGDFNSIDWSTGPYFIKIEMDMEGGDNYTVLGTSQLLSVPYALYAEKAANYNFIDTNCLNLNCSPWIKNGDKIYYNKGNVGIGSTYPENALTIEGSEEDWPGRIFLSIKNKSTSGKSLAYLKVFAGGDEYGTSLGHISNTYTANGSPEEVRDYGRLTSSGNGLIIDATKPDRKPGIIKFCNGMTDENIFIERMRIDKNGNIGIGTKEPMTKLEIADGDMYINGLNKGIIMKSPDEQCWRITVENDGSLISSPVDCP